jgi:hypothetical protein
VNSPSASTGSPPITAGRWQQAAGLSVEQPLVPSRFPQRTRT